MGSKRNLSPTMPITAAEVKKVIQAGDDFGHEMRVGKILFDLRQDCQKRTGPHNTTEIEHPKHGGTYTDAVTEKPRQFDYRCRINRINGTGQHAQCALLAIECKNLHESSPLVVCGRARTSQESYYHLTQSVYHEKTQQHSTFIRRVRTEQLYKDGGFVGKSLVRLKTENAQLIVDRNSSDVYDKWSQALASSVELVESARFFANSKSVIVFSVILPIVVLPNGLLWTVTYDDSGTIPQDPVKTDACEYFVERRVKLSKNPAFVLTHIHFVTLRGLSDLIATFWSHTSKWDWMVPSGGETVM